MARTPDELATLARTVEALRDRLGMSQEELAATAEVSRSTIQSIEAGGDRVPRNASLRRIARALNTDVATLWGEDPTPAEQAWGDRTGSDDELTEALDDLARANEAVQRILEKRRGHGESTGTR